MKYKGRDRGEIGVSFVRGEQEGKSDEEERGEEV